MTITEQLRDLFIKYLTQDSETRDARRKEFNCAIFDAKKGFANYCETDLDMVLEKFDRAVKEFGLANYVRLADDQSLPDLNDWAKEVELWSELDVDSAFSDGQQSMWEAGFRKVEL